MDQEKICKYRPYPPVRLKDRTWPDQTITRAPKWCSVDLRDGNQALIQPMNLEEKLEMFQLLVQIGFKEIEVGFPSASQIEYDFLRLLIEGNHIPDGVVPQVLTQAREHLIARTYEGLVGARRAIVHVYNSTSTLQRRVVFGQDMAGIKQIAVQGAQWVAEYAAKHPSKTEFVYQYSPESFSATEVEFANGVAAMVLLPENAPGRSLLSRAWCARSAGVPSRASAIRNMSAEGLPITRALRPVAISSMPTTAPAPWWPWAQRGWAARG